MSKYVKICPFCGIHNSEVANECEGCKGLLYSVEPIPEPLTPEPDVLLEDVAASVQPVLSSNSANFEKVVRREGEQNFKPPRRIYIENPYLPNAVEVQNGQTVGRADPTSRADVKISDKIPDIDCISRLHCQFDFDGRNWLVTAISNSTNNTAINGQVVPRGQSLPVRDGDVVTLANIPFRVRIIEWT